MSKFINKFVTVASTVALAASMLVLPATTHAASAGEVYKTTDGTVWFITSDMNRRPFTSWGAFQSYGFLSQAMIKEADSTVTALPAGAFIAPQDGRIFCATATKATDVAGECSLITGGQKAAFTSSAVFGSQGFSFANAFNGDSSFLSKTTNIDNGSAQHRAGVLVNNGGTVQLIVSGGLWGVPSMDVFNSWGWKASDVVPANSADKLLAQTGIIPGRMPGQLVPTATTSNPGTGDGTLSGGAGDATITATTADNETTVNEGDSNTFVNGFKVEASGSDVKLTSVKVALQQTGGSGTNGSTKLDRYADEVSVYEGSTKVGSMDVADFTKSGTTYTGSIPLTNAIVREGSANKQTFHVAVSAVSTIDSADLSSVHNVWQVTPSQVRFMDGTGVTLTSSSWSSSSSSFSFDSLASSGDVKFKVSTASDNPIAGNVEVSDTGSTSDVTLLKFKLNAVGSDVTFDTITITETATGTTPDKILSELQLKRGSTTLQTLAPRTSNGTSSFALDSDETVSADSSVTYTVTGKIQKIGTGSGNGTNFDEGDSLAVSFSDVNGLDQNDDAITETGSAVGETQTFFSQGISVSDFSSTVTPQDNGSGLFIKETYHISYKVHAFGNTYYVPKAVTRGTTVGSDQGLAFTIETSAGVVAPSTDAGASASSLTSPDALSTGSGNAWFTVPDGESRTFNVTIEVNRGSASSGAGVPGFYHVQLNQAGYDVDAVTGGTLGYTFAPAGNYETTDAKID